VAKVAYIAMNSSSPYDVFNPGPLGVRTGLKSQPDRDGKYAAAVINAVTPAIRAVNSTIPIGTPCTWWLQPSNINGFPDGISNMTAFWQQLYTDAGANIDAYTFFDGHYYTNTIDPTVGNNQTSTIAQWMTDFQNVSAANGDTGRQIWLTEFNWQANTTTTSSTAIAAGTRTITCGVVTGAAAGIQALIDTGANQETVTITSASGGAQTITAVFAKAHSGTYPVVILLDCDQATQATRMTAVLNAVIPGSNPNKNKIFFFTLWYDTTGGTGSSPVHWNGTSYDIYPEYGAIQTYLASFPPIASTDTFTRADQSGWGTASDGETWAVALGSATHFSIASNEGKITGATSIQTAYLGTQTSADQELLVRFSVSAVTDTAMLLLRGTASNTQYRIRQKNGSLDVLRAVAGATTTLASIPFTLAANIYYWLRARVQGSTISANIWADSGSELASAWMLSVVDNAPISGAGQFGLGATLTASTDTVKFDSMTLNPLSGIALSVTCAGAGTLSGTLDTPGAHLTAILAGTSHLTAMMTTAQTSSGGTYTVVIGGQII